MAPGARCKFGAPIFEPEIFRKQMYCIEECTCDIVGIFWRPAIIRRPRSISAPPEWFGAREIVPLALVVTPLSAARRYAPQQIMVHSSNQRHTGRSAFRRGKILNLPEFLCHFEEKRIGGFCRAVVLFQKLAQKYREVFPEFFYLSELLPASLASTQKLWQNTIYLQLSGLNN